MRLSGSSATAAALFRCAFALPVLGLLVLADRNRPGRTAMTARATWLARCSGLFLAGDLVLWAHSIAAVGAGLATVLGNLQVLLVALVAWSVLGERPDRSLFVALPVMFAGVGLVGGLVGTGTYGAHPTLGVVFGIGTSILYAGYILILRHAMSAPPWGCAPHPSTPGEAKLAPASRRARCAPTPAPDGLVVVGAVGVVRPLYEATLGATVGAAALALTAGDFRVGPSWPALGWLALLAVSSQVVGWLLISVSLPKLPAALTSTLLLVQPVGAIGLGALIFGESPSPEQLAGVGLILLGVVISTAGRPIVSWLYRSRTPEPRLDPKQGDTLRALAPPDPRDPLTRSAPSRPALPDSHP